MNARRGLLWALGLCLLARLWGIDAPLTGVHAWRQCDTAAVARNFAEQGMNPLYPRVDWRGDGPGFVEMEFPAFSYAAAAVYRVVGVHEWVGRLLAALGGVVACLYVYRLVAWSSGDKAGLWSAGVFAVLPLNIYYGRAFMPESWMLAASAAGVFHFLRWRETGSVLEFAAAAVGVSFACLLKFPTLCLGLPLLWLAWKFPAPASGGVAATRNPLRLYAEPQLWLFALAVLMPVAAWYWWAHLLGQQTGLSFGVWTSDKFAAWDMTLSVRYWYELIVEKIFERHVTWAGVVLLVAGVCRRRESQRERLFDVWSLALLVFFAIVAKGNSVHEYYQLPIAIPAAFYCGRVLALGWEKRWRLWAPIAAAVVVLSIGRLVDYQWQGELKGRALLELAADIRARGFNRSGIVVVSGKLPGDPSLLYHAHAKGWALGPAPLSAEELARIRDRGGLFVCGVKETFASVADAAWLSDLLGRYRVIRDDRVGFVVETTVK